jgi:RadC-like JAB domain
MTYLQDSEITIKDSKDVAKVFLDLLRLEDKIDQDKEHFYVMHLDIRSRVKLVELVSLGTLNSSLTHPRETFRRAIMQGSASIIVMRMEDWAGCLKWRVWNFSICMIMRCLRKMCGTGRILKRP